MQIYQTVAPPAILQPFVRYFWRLENNRADEAVQTFRAIVDGCPGAIILGPDKQSFYDEHNHQLPGKFLYGQTIKPIKLSVDGSFEAIGICFQPNALKSVFGLDAHELTSACVELPLLAGRKRGQLSEELFEAASWQDRLSVVSSFLIEQLQQHDKKPDHLTNEALASIIQTHGTIDLKQLQQHLRLSERGMERRFKQTIGIPPKLFARICRFQQSLNQLRRSAYNKLSDIAYEQEYADQSHFIRAFKEFTGCSPLAFKKQSNEVVENFPQINR